jgi:hypothetical protein
MAGEPFQSLLDWIARHFRVATFSIICFPNSVRQTSRQCWSVYPGMQSYWNAGAPLKLALAWTAKHLPVFRFEIV